MKKILFYITLVILSMTNSALAQQQQQTCAIVAVNNGQSKLISINGQTITKNEYLDISIFKEGYWSARKKLNDDTIAGYIDSNGVEHSFDFKNTYDFSEGFAVVELENGKYNFIDSTFNLITTNGFDFAMDFNEGFAAIRQEGKWSFISSDGNLLLEPKYDDVFQFINGFASVRKEDKYGFINKRGEEVVETKYRDWRSFSEDGLAFMIEEGRNSYVVIDSTGNIILGDQNFSLSDPYFNEIDLVKVHQKIGESTFKYGYANKKGEIVIPIKYDRLESFHHSQVTGAGTKGSNGLPTFVLIDTSGNIINNTQHDYIHSYYEGGIAIVSDSYLDSKPIDRTIKYDELMLEYMDFQMKSGLIDTMGNLIVPKKYNRLHPVYSLHKDNHFNEQCLFFAQLERKGVTGVIDDKGEIIIPFNYSLYKRQYLGNGVFYMVDMQGEGLFYDTKIGEEIRSTSLQFDKSITVCENTLIVILDSMTGKKGLKNGDLENWIIKPEFDEIVLSNKHNNLYHLKGN